MQTEVKDLPPSAPSGTSVGERAIKLCTDEFNKFAAGADKQQRALAWAAFQYGWTVALQFAANERSPLVPR